ncbi:protein Aim7p [Monosporozyma servazzii]
MSSLYKIATGTKDTIRKFRTSTARAEKIKCLSIKIEPSPSYAIVIDKEEQEELDEDLNDLNDLSEILPDNTPRFVLMAYPLTTKDGIKQTPLILLYWKPQTVVSSEWKMLYAGALEIVRNECGTSKMVEVTSGLEDEDDVEELIQEIEFGK